METRNTEHLATVHGGEPVVFHCHHYNAVLQQSIEDAGSYVDAPRLLQDGAVAIAHGQFMPTFAGKALDSRKDLAATYFREHGFGSIDTWEITAEGGTVTVSNSVYALGWQARAAAGAKREPVCFFVAGFLEGVTAALWNAAPGTYEVRETQCRAAGADHCVFSIAKASKPRTFDPSVGAGAVEGPMPERPTQPPHHTDEAAIGRAIATLPLVGNEEGLIPAFGVYLTQHYANYYSFISYELENRIKEPHLKAAVQNLLVESGHVCAFNTFGGIMSSPEWDAVVKPMIRERSDWIFGMVAIVNCLGWGRWTVLELHENERLRMRVDSSYESNYFVKKYPRASAPKCYLCQGGVAGLMNLLYVGDIATKPKLTPEYYEALFSASESFTATEVHCRAQGHPHCEFVAERRSF